MKGFWMVIAISMCWVLTMQTSDLALSLIENPPHAFFAPLETGQTISYTLDNPDNA